jgi:AraC-like DNA-binding protein
VTLPAGSAADSIERKTGGLSMQWRGPHAFREDSFIGLRWKLSATPGAHQRRLRLDRGAYLLLTSRATILDIALETGFENHETFTRAFRERFQVTPSAFRKNSGHELPWSMRAGFSIAVHIGCAKKNL